MNELKIRLKANLHANNLKNPDLDKFLLNNPIKLDKEVLIQVVEQYIFRKKLQDKMPKWAENPEIIGYDRLSVEQASSGITGNHKFRNFKGEISADLTGGFGVDSYFLSKKVSKHFHIESRKNLQEIVVYNFDKLGIKNTEFLNQNAEDFLKETKNSFDLIYLDPDRRNDKNQKLVGLADCSPNLIEILPNLLRKTERVLVKLSPLFDISLLKKQIVGIEKMELVAVKNELKELLVWIKKDTSILPEVVCYNYQNEENFTEFHIPSKAENLKNTEYGLIEKFLFEPDVNLMKSGAFGYIATYFGILKLAANSHLFSGEIIPENFPGRTYSIVSVKEYKPKDLKAFKNQGFNIVCRNFPIKPEEIRKSFGIKEGSDQFLIFSQNSANKKIVINCTRI